MPRAHRVFKDYKVIVKMQQKGDRLQNYRRITRLPGGQTNFIALIGRGSVTCKRLPKAEQQEVH